MALEDCFNEHDGRFAKIAKAHRYQDFLEEIKKYKENEPEVYDQMLKDFEKSERETYYGLVPNAHWKTDGSKGDENL